MHGIQLEVVVEWVMKIQKNEFALPYIPNRKTGQAGLEAAFKVPMPGDSPDAGSISKYCSTQEIFHSNPTGILTQL